MNLLTRSEFLECLIPSAIVSIVKERQSGKVRKTVERARKGKSVAAITWREIRAVEIALADYRQAAGASDRFEFYAVRIPNTGTFYLDRGAFDALRGDYTDLRRSLVDDFRRVWRNRRQAGPAFEASIRILQERIRTTRIRWRKLRLEAIRSAAAKNVDVQRKRTRRKVSGAWKVGSCTSVRFQGRTVFQAWVQD